MLSSNIDLTFMWQMTLDMIKPRRRCCWMFAVKIKTCFTVISRQRQKILEVQNFKDTILYAPMAIKMKITKKFCIRVQKKYTHGTRCNLNVLAQNMSKKRQQSVFDAGHVDSSNTRAGITSRWCFLCHHQAWLLPYVLLSYTHRLSDVFTLAHEIGHSGAFHCSIR